VPIVNGQPDVSRAIQVDNLRPPQHITAAQTDRRLALLDEVERGFQADRPEIPVVSHAAAYNQAVRLMKSNAVDAFGFPGEPEKLRERYGNTPFGQGCLLARRLVEQGVPFVDVTLANTDNAAWDSHQSNFPAVKSLSEVLDRAWSALLSDLEARGLLETTLIVWMGEFGRTPQINGNAGRDHFPGAWSAVLAGGGIRGGQVIGRTSDDGMTIADRPVSEADFLATVCLALGVDPTLQNISNVGRPIRLVDPKAAPLQEILT
jgi:hypothetical protein